MITADQIVCHAVGDYMLQSDWMANGKTGAWRPAIAHVLTYMLPFLLLTQSPAALAVIVGTHIVIDHYRLARYVCWLKNFIAPRGSNRPWSECAGTGYPAERPAWLSVWLLIIADNVMHVVINALALRYL